jgi:hypothetical protein
MKNKIKKITNGNHRKIELTPNLAIFDASEILARHSGEPHAVRRRVVSIRICERAPRQEHDCVEIPISRPMLS